MDSRKKQKDLSVVMSEMGKIPPQAIDIEEAVLGALIITQKAINKVPLLKHYHFYKDSHQIIFKAIQALDPNKMDLYMIVEQLKKEERLEQIGGPYYLTQLTNKVASSAMIEVHAQVLIDKYKQRTLIQIAHNLQNAGFEADCVPDNVGGTIIKDLVQLQKEGVILRYQGMEGMIKEELALQEKIQSGEDTFPGHMFYIKSMDKLLMGINDDDLIIIAGRPSMGKTAFALEVAKRSVKRKEPVAIFSLEMGYKQLNRRLISSETKIPMIKFKGKFMSNEEMELFINTTDTMKQWPLYVDDTGAINIEYLKAQARILVNDYGVRKIFIDYIQLMTGNGRSREEIVSAISRELKALSKELQIPIIALAQLNRDVESTKDKRPMLSHLRESGSIEQDADVVILLYRPEYYGITEFETEQGIESTRNACEVIIAKNRNGSIGSCYLVFKREIQEFFDSEEKESGYDPNYVLDWNDINEKPPF